MQKINIMQKVERGLRFYGEYSTQHVICLLLVLRRNVPVTSIMFYLLK